MTYVLFLLLVLWIYQAKAGSASGVTYVSILFGLTWLFQNLRLLRENERGLILRLGRPMNDPSAPAMPGVRWVLWPIDTLVRWNVLIGDENLLGAQGV